QGGQGKALPVFGQDSDGYDRAWAGRQTAQEKHHHFETGPQTRTPTRREHFSRDNAVPLGQNRLHRVGPPPAPLGAALKRAGAVVEQSPRKSEGRNGL